MKNNNNIDSFNKCAASVLAHLYTQFPLPMDLDFNKQATLLWESTDDQDDSFDKLELVYRTVDWLHKAEYVWLKSIDDWTALQVVLSPKGLELLKLPSSLKSGASFGEKIGKAIEEGTKDVAAGLVSKALTLGWKFLATKMYEYPELP